MVEVVIATAGLGTANFRSAAERVKRQSEDLKCVSKTIILVEENLGELCPHISTKYSNYLNPETRGYGFMAWKAELACTVLSEYEGEVLYLWVDAGCEISSTRLSQFKFNRYVSRLKKFGYLFYCLETPENEYTKASLYSYFSGVNPSDATPQAQTTFFGLYGELGLNIARRWFEVVSSSIDTVNEDNSYSNKGERVLHRHDQSVFSLVLKEFGLEPNIYPLRDDRGSCKACRFIKYMNDPILAARNRTGDSWSPFNTI